MTIGLVGRKVGMTRIFTDDGGTLPVTVLDVSDNRITQIKTADRDGYAAVQVTFGKRRATRVNKALAGHLAKAAVEAGHVLKEFRVAKAEELGELKAGGKVGVEMFKVGQRVDVQGVTIGKGFAGVIKRHHFGGQNASHGNSISHRVPGSTGQNQSPGHVFKGKRMPGHLGNAKRTISNLEIVRIDEARQLLLVKGSVPGSSGRDVVVRLAVKGQKAPVKVQAKAAAKPGGQSAARPAAQPPKPAAQPPKPAAQPLKPAAQPAKPAAAKS
jgi:large subunit ribosomal protein L3